MRIRAHAILREILGWSVYEMPIFGPAGIRDVLSRLADRFPALAHLLWRADGQAADYIILLLNGKAVDYAADMTLLEDDDVLGLFPPLPGG